MANKSMAIDEKSFQAESDLRTLIEAEKIRKDKSRLSAALKKRKEMVDAMQSIDGKKEE